MSVKNPRISVAWLAYYCGDNQMVEELIPDHETVQDRREAIERKTQEEGLELFDFEDSELLFELAGNYWILDTDQRSLSNSIASSKTGLIRCVIWPLSDFRFEGRAYLTDLSVEIEREVAYHLLRTRLKAVGIEKSSGEVPLYKGSWRYESDSFVAEVTSCDFGLFRISAILKESKKTAKNSNLFSDLESLLDEIVPD